ncbi:MAG: SCP2 sterol-binding domain-containing protein [Solirubrobacteraceae bacterium]|nr:SCP2 sterol-binding domain-containing protein [Solirubrobacteraceae bacterium]
MSSDPRFSGIDADHVARNLRHMDDASVAEMVGGSMRQPVLDEVFRRMAEHVDPEKAAGVDVLVRFEIEGENGGAPDRYDVHFHDGEVKTSREQLGEPVAILRCGPVEFMRMVLGGVSGLVLFEAGKLTVEGDLETAGRLRSLFAIPGSS